MLLFSSPHLIRAPIPYNPLPRLGRGWRRASLRSARLPDGHLPCPLFLEGNLETTGEFFGGCLAFWSFDSSYAVHEGVEEMEFCVFAPPKRRCFKRQVSQQAGSLACHGEAMCLKYGFGAIARVRRRVFAPHRSLRSDRGETRASIQGGVLRLGASSVAMSYATAPFCKTHRQNRSASFPLGAAGGDKTRRFTCANASWFEGGETASPWQACFGGAGVRISSTPSCTQRRAKKRGA